MKFLFTCLIVFPWQTDLYHHVRPAVSSWFTVFASSQVKSNQFICNRSVSVCFRPPRDLDSKACVTIGEKVILFLWTHFWIGTYLLSSLPFSQIPFKVYIYFFSYLGLLHNSSLFTLSLLPVCFWFSQVPRSLNTQL